MYNMWPESVPFRDVADLNFPAYLDKIKEPIALDVIKERLDEENPDQYAGTRAFLADLRKMFRNCFTFNVKESEIYKHARKLEDKLDKLLEVQYCVPNFLPKNQIYICRPGLQSLLAILLWTFLAQRGIRGGFRIVKKIWIKS